MLKAGATESVIWRTLIVRHGRAGGAALSYGTEGDLQLAAGGGQAQIFEKGGSCGQCAQPPPQSLPVPEQYRWAPPQGPGPSTNVAQAYARFARDYREGTYLCPTFEDAVTRHRMLNAIETAAATGQRQTLG